MTRRGFVRARVDGQVVRLTDDLKLDKRIKHHIEIVIDRLKNDAKIRPRLAEAVEQALTLGEGAVIIAVEVEPPAEANGGRQPPGAVADESQDQGADAPRSPAPYDDLLLSAHYA